MINLVLSFFYILRLILNFAPEINPIQGHEKFDFNVYVFGVYSGKATLQTIPYGEDYILTGKIDSDGLFDSFYPVHNFAKSFLDGKSFLPRKYVMKTVENHVVSHYLLKFFPEKKEFLRVKIKFREKSRRVARRSFKITGYDNVHDFLSALMFVRSRKLDIGKSYYFFGFSGNYLYKVKFFAEKKEFIYTEKGNRKAIKVKAQIVRWNPRKDRPSRMNWKKVMNMWFSDDSRHIPLRISVDLFVGQVTVVLTN